MKTKLIITDKPDWRIPEPWILRFSNKQWLVKPSKLEGYEFSDVIVRCRLEDTLRDWLHMHIGIRIDRIIYENPFNEA